MTRKILGGVAFVVAVTCLLWGGLALRAAVWDWTMPVRFNGDIENGYHWGTVANEIGYFNIYDELGQPTRERMDECRAVDYGPLRLGVMSYWVHWLHIHYPGVHDREPSAAFHAPLLWFNTSLEALTAVATFVLVWLVLRGNRWRAWIALAGAALTWLNPLIIYEAHAWPQWDIWPMPFYLFALCGALRGRWLLAGLLIGTAAMLKGQVLMVAWTLPVWAIVLGDWRGAIRFCVGVAASILLIGIVWELSIYVPGQDGFSHFVGQPDVALRRPDYPAIAWVMLWLTAAIALPRRFSASLICFALAATLGSTFVLFNASSNWFQSGLVIGTWHFPTMMMGSTSNLPAILATNYRWNDPNAFLFDAGFPVTMRTLLLVLYFATSLWCAVWAAIHARRRDPRVVLAICLPWLLFYCLPAQIHERYIIFFSVCAGALVVCGLGWTCLGILVTLIGFGITFHNALAASQIPPLALDNPRHTFFTVAHYLVRGTHPGIAWALLLICVMGLFSITGRRRMRED